MPLKVAKPSTVRTEVAHAIRDAIAQGTLHPGERLNERQLCAEAGVSRTSLREALRQLETEGFIVTLPHRGAVVAQLDRKEIREIYEVRASLEALAAQSFAKRASAVLKHRLTELFEVYETAVERESVQDQVDAKRRYYDFLFTNCGNATAARLAGVLVDRVNQLRTVSLSAPGRSKQALLELRSLNQCITSGKADEASTAARHHVEAALQTLESVTS